MLLDAELHAVPSGRPVRRNTCAVGGLCLAVPVGGPDGELVGALGRPVPRPGPLAPGVDGVLFGQGDVLPRSVVDSDLDALDAGVLRPGDAAHPDWVALDMIAQAEHIPMHLGSLLGVVNSAIAALEDGFGESMDAASVDHTPEDHRETLSPDSDELEAIEQADEESLDDDIVENDVLDETEWTTFLNKRKQGAMPFYFLRWMTKRVF